MTNNPILVINSGSSSIKFSLIDVVENQVRLSALAEKLGGEGACLHITNNAAKERIMLPDTSHAGAMAAFLSALLENGLSAKIKAVGHRVVHGAEHFKAACIINDEVIAAIESCIPFAPLHNPANLAGIRAAQHAFPGVPQVAVFDTAFHQTLQPHAYHYAIPGQWYKRFGARRYGFHGTSHRYVSIEAARILQIPLENSAFVTAHLGNGASASAVLDGKSVDTSMGFTPLEGLVMGTRSGDIDPGLIPYIAQCLEVSVEKVISLLNKESGLLGLSGLSGDVRTLQESAAAGHKGAILAIEVFVFRLAKYIGALTVSLPRVDALVFTGGIGENSASIREKVLNRLDVLGYRVDQGANNNAVGGKAGLISSPGSVNTLVINTNEELIIAMDTASLVDN